LSPDPISESGTITTSALSDISLSESEMKPFPISEISQSESETTTPPAIQDILLAESENMIKRDYSIRNNYKNNPKIV
jgi:hypothetical protein